MVHKKYFQPELERCYPAESSYISRIQVCIYNFLYFYTIKYRTILVYLSIAKPNAALRISRKVCERAQTEKGELRNRFEKRHQKLFHHLNVLLRCANLCECGSTVRHTSMV